MRYRNLGRSGLKVSEISLGSWLTFGGVVEEETAGDCIRRAYELGVNFFDTANVYSQGRAEEVLGRVLGAYPRSSFVLATKAFFPMGQGPNDRGNSRKHLFEQCDASLRRLRTDYVDLYQLHRFDPETPVEETLRALDDLQSQGKILYAGVSEWNAAQIREAAWTAKQLNLRPLISNQPNYSLLVRYNEPEVLGACREAGLGWVVFSPLAQGILTGKYKPGSKPAKGTRGADKRQNMWMGDNLKDDVLKRVARFTQIAGKLKCLPAQLALAWCLRLPEVASVITGATKVSQVEDNVKATGIKVADSVWRELDALFPIGAQK